MKTETESIVSINELELDRECIRLPSDYLKYAIESANQKRKVDGLKAQMDVVQSETSSTIRKNPEKFGLEKVTESGLSAAVLLQSDYQTAQEDLINARHQQELAQAVVWAVECKKRSLTLLVELHGMGYFSNPKISERGKEAVEEMTKRKVRHHSDD